MRPAPPVRFSTTTERPRPTRSLSARMRASASPPPPAANGKMMRTGCSCAWATGNQTSTTNAARRTRRRPCIIASPHHGCGGPEPALSTARKLELAGPLLSRAHKEVRRYGRTNRSESFEPDHPGSGGTMVDWIQPQATPVIVLCALAFCYALAVIAFVLATVVVAAPGRRGAQDHLARHSDARLAVTSVSSLRFRPRASGTMLRVPVSMSDRRPAH